MVGNASAGSGGGVFLAAPVARQAADEGDHCCGGVSGTWVRVLNPRSHFCRARPRLDDEGVLDRMVVGDVVAGLNKLLDGLQVEIDEKPWYG